MTLLFSYKVSELADTASTGYTRNRIRLLIGDTSTSRAFNLDDAEVDYFADTSSNIHIAAANAAEALGARYLEAADSKKVGDLALSKVKGEGERLAAKARELRRRAAAGALPIIGGVSIADKQAREDDTDRPTPAFARGQHDYPGSGQPGGTSNSESDWST